MALTGGIKYNFPAIESCSTDLNSLSVQLQGHLDTLDQQVRTKLQAVWLGDAAGAADTSQANWLAASADLRAALAQLSTSTSNCGTGMQGADKANMGRFAGGS